jgi:hypothetical protein
MKIQIILLALLMNIYLFGDSLAQKMPLVYDVENTGADCPIPYLPSISELPNIQSLPDPFEWADGRGRMSNFSDWRYRRAEIGAQIQNYEIGEKPPRPDTITASYSGGVLTVIVTVNGKTLTLTATIALPAGNGPFPAVIGVSFGSTSLPSDIFSSRNIATIAYQHDQVTTYANLFTGTHPSNSDPYFRLYPSYNLDNMGQYSAWAWGVSRIIDGLELVQNVLPIDLKHLAVSGCSYAGKLALFAGALDERIALTIALESGGGGATSWRYTHANPEHASDVEGIDNTDYNWFMNSMHQFSGDNVSYLPEDHHELMAMCAPRALYVTANPWYEHLSNPSCYVCSRACQQVYNTLGIADRFGFSIPAAHSDHCNLPVIQIPEVGAFVDKFLLGIDSVNTNISISPYNIDLSSWIAWTTPTLANGTSYFGITSLLYPSNLQIGLDSTVTVKWTKVQDAQKYFIQLSRDPTFAIIDKSDSTTLGTDTVKTFTGLLKSKKYYWRVQVKSAAGLGPWSALWNFITTVPPAKPELIAVTPDSIESGSFRFKFNWKKTQYADQYLLQTSDDSTFAYVYKSASTSDTAKTLSGFPEGQNYYWRVRASNVSGSGPWSTLSSFPTTPTAVKGEEGGIPTEYSISQNYPNPFNPTTKIKFALPQRSLTKLIIYDLLGREIQTLINKELEAGYHEINFDATNFPSGVYFYRIQTGNFIQTKKMILMK